MNMKLILSDRREGRERDLSEDGEHLGDASIANPDLVSVQDVVLPVRRQNGLAPNRL